MARNMINKKLKRFGVSLDEIKQEKNLSYKRRSGEKVISDYPCHRIDVLSKSRKIEELWITEWENIEHQAQVKSAYIAMIDFMNSLRTLVDESVYRSYVQMPFIRCQFKDKLKGMPIGALHFDKNNNITTKSTLKNIEHKKLPPETFSPPEHYEFKKLKLPR